MKSRFWIVIALLLIFSLVLGFLLWPRPQARRITEQIHPEADSNGPAPASTKAQQSNQSPSPSSASAPSTVSPWTEAKTDPKRREDMFREMIEAKNAPIDFYCKVIDQNSNAIAGVKVRMKVRQWVVVAPVAGGEEGQMIPIEKETGANGEFEIHGQTGDGFDVEYVQRNGYELSPKAPRHYGPSSGSLENPVIMRMWKTGDKEPLVSGQKVFGMIPDGRVYTVDFLTGKKIEGEQPQGDLVIRIVRSDEAKPHSKFQWSFSVEAIGGGISETDDEFMYWAPESGYEAKVAVEFKPADESWTSLAKRRFFFRSRQGQVYGRLQVEVHAIYNDKSAFEVEYAVNPAGSRNLQP